MPFPVLLADGPARGDESLPSCGTAVYRRGHAAQDGGARGRPVVVPGETAEAVERRPDQDGLDEAVLAGERCVGDPGPHDAAWAGGGGEDP